MNKWHVMTIIRRVRDEQKAAPRADWWVAAVALLLAFLFPLVTSDFKDALGIDKATWHAVDLLGVLATFVIALLLLVRWVSGLVGQFRNPPQTEEQIVDRVIEEMKAHQSGEG